MSRRTTVVIGLLGTVLDRGEGPRRWERWRPSVAVCGHEDLLVDRFEVLHQPQAVAIALQVKADIATLSPETEVRLMPLSFADPWDFEEVYATLHDFATCYPFDPENEEYLIHITTGTHVAQICLFLLTESRHLPAVLLQTGPAESGGSSAGTYRLIDLDLARYDRIALRFRREQLADVGLLKSGIATRNETFNLLIERLERVAASTTGPILLTGPTGAGKSLLARRIYDLKRARRLVEGPFVEVNCATIRGDAAMSTLFGHTRGAFTGAMRDRPGLLLSAHRGILFLDEIGELGADEQAMLLRALEEKVFLPLGGDREVSSDFQLLAGTNRDLRRSVREGRFRADLLARVDVWTFELPGLAQRPEDIEPNLDFELEQFAHRTGSVVRMSREARERFLYFATSREAAWSGNFRDLGGAVTRMATLSVGGRITPEVVGEEIHRLRGRWITEEVPTAPDLVSSMLGEEKAAMLDPFERVQLAEVLKVCSAASSLSAAGRVLFATSRRTKKSSNDADRLRKYLLRFGLEWSALRERTQAGPTAAAPS